MLLVPSDIGDVYILCPKVIFSEEYLYSMEDSNMIVPYHNKKYKALGTL